MSCVAVLDRSSLLQNVNESLRSIVPPEDLPDLSAPTGVSKLLESIGPGPFLTVLSLLNGALLALLKRSQVTLAIIVEIHRFQLSALSLMLTMFASD